MEIIGMFRCANSRIPYSYFSMNREADPQIWACFAFIFPVWAFSNATEVYEIA